jgi:DNA-binding phage protein
LLDKCDYTEITKKTGLSKSTLYRMCEPDANPTFVNIGKVLNFINHMDILEAA